MTRNCPLCGTDVEPDVSICQCGYKFALGAQPADSGAVTAPDTSPFAIAGWLLTIAGALLSLYAYSGFDPSVDGYVAGDYASLGRRIVNTGLLQDQLMLFHTGLALSLAGVMALCTAAVTDAIRSAKAAS